MKLIKKLKALFIKDETPISLNLAAAEIIEGRAFLHPKEDRNLTYLVKSDDIEIRLGNGKHLTDTDIMVIKKRKCEKSIPKKEKETAPKQDTDKKENQAPDNSGAVLNNFDRFKKKTFSVSLYPEEYEKLMEAIQKYGYKRSEFILASAQTATQSTMAKAQKKVVMVRKELRKEERELKSKQAKTH